MSNGAAISNVKVTDKQSCVRAGELFKKQSRYKSDHFSYTCTEITK